MIRKIFNAHIWTLILITFVLASSVEATVYYIDQNNPSSNDQNIGTIDRPWKTITKANQTLKAGDTVYIMAGTYSSYIAPTKSGTSGSRITYKNYENDIVTISSAAYAIYLSGKNYITVQGINATSCRHFLWIINGANYNEIGNCSFDNNNNADWNHSVIHNSQYNWIHDSQFSKGGSASSGGQDNGSVLDIGDEYDSSDNTNYNLIEDCVFFHGGHHVIALMSSQNTIRNNYIHNEAWTSGYGNRNLYSNAPSGVDGKNVIEGNRWGYSATSVDDGDVGNVVLCSPYNIVRYNSIYHSSGYGLGMTGYSGFSNAVDNRIYNNTFFNNGLSSGGAVYLTNEAGQSPTGNVFKNNLYYSNDGGNYTGNRYSTQTYANEFTPGNPLFTNVSTTPPADKTDQSVPDLTLTSGSPAINAGGALTTVTVADTGSGTSLIVSDASYFQDGSYAPPGKSSADWIAVGTVGNTVQISSISGNTITLSNSISRNDGDSVWLYKKSDGAAVFIGDAPDAGAHEFLKTGNLPSPPKNLRIVSN